MNLPQLLTNRAQFPPDELAKYAGKYVAWSPNGTQILTSDDDEHRLDGAIRAMGIDPAEILVSYVPSPDEIILGGAGDPE